MGEIKSNKATNPGGESPRPFGTGHTLVGKDFSTADLVSKVTGSSKYTEDFRAEGMLFCRLVLSPMPHGRVKHIDASEALAMPGVRGILTADEILSGAGLGDDNGEVIKVGKWAEAALTNEPRFQGCPIMAVAAVDELTCAEAIEKIKIDMEPLPFVLDPLETLRPGSPNPHADGNVWVRLPAPPNAPPGPPPMIVKELKWTEKEFAGYSQGNLPMGSGTGVTEWKYGNLEKGFKDAALVLDETFVTPDVGHDCLEPRSAMAYWQNGKLYMHTGTQGLMQTLPTIARWMHMDPRKIVLISEYTGGGFGSKISPGITLMIPALLSKKLNAPVMMRLSREDEHFVGRARPSICGRVKIGFAKDGRIMALDMYSICNSGAYDAAGDAGTSGAIPSLIYQPAAMRFRSVTVMTNTPTRAAMRGPGGVQGVMIMEPILAKAARKLGVDQVVMRRLNSPEGKALYGPPAQGKRRYATSCFLKEALDHGAEQFKWSERVARPRRSGAKARGIGVAVSSYTAGTIGFDGLLVITPEGRVRFHCGCGNLGTASAFAVHRAGAEALGVPWEQVDVVWGDSSRALPYTSGQNGSQTIHAMSRASLAVATAARQRIKEIAAKTHGGGTISLAEAARQAIKLGGIYDGHEAPAEVNKVTKQAVAALAGQGLVVAAKDSYPRDGDSYSFIAGFAEVEVDLETGKYDVTDCLSYVDVGTVVHPAALGGQINGGAVMGIGHAVGQKWVLDPQHGATLSRRFLHTKPPTILDVPVYMKWNALNIPDPETPVGARGVAECVVGAAAGAVLNALADALGDEVFRRAPVNADTILTSLEAGRPMQHPFMAHI